MRTDFRSHIFSLTASVTKRVNIIAAGLLAIFTFFFFGTTLFIHTHTEEDGTRIVHSHPWTPGSSHSHTSDQLLTINMLSGAMQCMMTAETLHVSPVHEVKYINSETSERIPDKRRANAAGTRAPPMVG